MEPHENVASMEATAVETSNPESRLGGGVFVKESDWIEDDEDEDGNLAWMDPDFNPEGQPGWSEENWDGSNDYQDFEEDAEEDSANYMPNYMSKVTVFERSFCSFMQSIHGGERRSEKFSYLVVQKIIGGSDLKQKADEANPFRDLNVADLLANSVDSANGDTVLLKDAVNAEDRFLDSNADELGLELVQGRNLSSWGRLVRPPLKKKGHVIIDFCSGENMGEGDGQIIRHRVARGKISKVAPGTYISARKARWGGLWPDISSRLNALSMDNAMFDDPSFDAFGDDDGIITVGSVKGSSVTRR